MWHSGGRHTFRRHHAEESDGSDGSMVDHEEIPVQETTDFHTPVHESTVVYNSPEITKPSTIYGHKFWLRLYENVLFFCTWLMDQMVPEESTNRSVLLLNLLESLEYVKRWTILLLDFFGRNPMVATVFVLPPVSFLTLIAAYLVLMIGYTMISIIAFAIVFTISFVLVTLLFTPLIILGSAVILSFSLFLFTGYATTTFAFPYFRRVFTIVADRIPPSVGVSEITNAKPVTKVEEIKKEVQNGENLAAN